MSDPTSGRVSSCRCGCSDESHDLPGVGCAFCPPRECGPVKGRVSSPPPLLIEQSKTTGEWSWFCEREGCHWSGHGWMTEGGARREGERHECRAA